MTGDGFVVLTMSDLVDGDELALFDVPLGTGLAFLLCAIRCFFDGGL